MKKTINFQKNTKGILCSIILLIATLMVLFPLTSCHKHKYSTEFKFNDETHWKECECGKKKKTASHKWDSGVITEEATERTSGKKVYTCSVCSNTKTEVIDRLPHEHVQKSQWFCDDENHWKECEKCDDKLNVETHSWNEGTIITQPTYELEGEKEFECSVCAKKIVSPIDVLPKKENTITLNEGIELVVSYGSGFLLNSESFTTNTSISNILFKQKDADDSSYSSEMPTGIGEYVVSVTAKAENEWLEKTVTYEFKIEKKGLSVASSYNVPCGGYNGYIKILNKADGIVETDEVFISCEIIDLSAPKSFAVNAKNLVLCGKDSSNYYISDNPSKHVSIAVKSDLQSKLVPNIEIIKKEVANVTIGSETFSYSYGLDFVIDNSYFSVTNGVEFALKFSKAGDDNLFLDQPTQAGDYKVIVITTENELYQCVRKTFNLRIRKKIITLPEKYQVKLGEYPTNVILKLSTDNGILEGDEVFVHVLDYVVVYDKPGQYKPNDTILELIGEDSNNYEFYSTGNQVVINIE